MLNSLRSFVGSWAAKILLVLLVGSFALWGISGSLFSQADLNTVATVGETNINAREFMSAYQRNLNQVQQATGQRLTREQARMFGVEARSLSDVVAFGTLDEYARRSGLALSDSALAKMIGDNPAFQDSSGQFNKDAFRRAVYEARMQESDYVKLQDRAAVRSQLTESFATGNILPTAYADALRHYAGEQRTFSYITITPQIAGEVVPPTDDALATWFEVNKADYAAPEYRKLTLLVINPEILSNESAISDEDVAADYESRADSYVTPEKRRVQQVVFANKAAAEAAAEKLAAGELYETVMSEAGLTPADLGLVAQSELPKGLGEAAFALDLNTPSAVVDGPFGPTLLRVTEVTEEKRTTLDEVRDAIRRDLALRAAADRVNTLYDDIEDARAGGATLSEIAAQFGLETRTVDMVDRDARDENGTIIKDLPASRDLLEQAFTTRVGAQSGPVDFGNGEHVWFDVENIIAGRERTLDEARARVLSDWTAEQRADLVRKKAESLMARMGEGVTLETLSAELGAPVETAGPMGRNGATEIFPRDAVAKGFEGRQGAIFTAPAAMPENVLLAGVSAVTEAEDSLPEQALDSANESAANDLLNQLITDLQNAYTVSQNPAAIDYALTNLR